MHGHALGVSEVVYAPRLAVPKIQIWRSPAPQARSPALEARVPERSEGRAEVPRAEDAKIFWVTQKISAGVAGPPTPPLNPGDTLAGALAAQSQQREA